MERRKATKKIVIPMTMTKWMLAGVSTPFSSYTHIYPPSPLPAACPALLPMLLRTTTRHTTHSLAITDPIPHFTL